MSRRDRKFLHTFSHEALAEAIENAIKRYLPKDGRLSISPSMVKRPGLFNLWFIATDVEMG